MLSERYDRLIYPEYQRALKHQEQVPKKDRPVVKSPTLKDDLKRAKEAMTAKGAKQDARVQTTQKAK
ncbi:MAG: hypothetical protein LBC35_07230 [Coriobacteriales bacterium]|jgi:hypothetical protein|nr:hypothetical protein [Coriobacteriales bacterium]